MKKNLQKMFGMLLAGCFLFAAIGCGMAPNSGSTASTDSIEITGSGEGYTQGTESGTNVSDPVALFDANSNSEIMEEAWDLIDRMAEASYNNDYEAFRDLYYSPDENVVSSQFQSIHCIREYDRHKGYVFDKWDNYCLVAFTYYIVSGTYPNTHSDDYTGSFLFTRQDGKLKVVGSYEIIEQVQERIAQKLLQEYDKGVNLLQDAYPGRINQTFFSCCMLAANREIYYEEDVGALVSYMMQKENGDVLVVLWFKNGTDQDRSMYNIRVTVEDQALGTVIDEQIDDTVTVRAKSTLLRVYTIPANRVFTGTQAWGTMNSNVHTSSK